MNEQKTDKTKLAEGDKPRICGHLEIVALLRKEKHDELADKMLAEWKANNLPCETCQGDPSMENKCTFYIVRGYQTNRERVEEALQKNFRREINDLRKGY